MAREIFCSLFHHFYSTTASKHSVHSFIRRHITLKNWRKFSLCRQITLVLWGLFFLAFFLEASVFTLPLAFLAPLAYVYRLLEHRVVSLYLVLVLFIQLGGLADLGSDVVYLGRLLWYSIWNNNLSVPGDSGDENEVNGILSEYQLLLIRLIITTYGVIPVFFFGHIVTSVADGNAKVEGKNEEHKDRFNKLWGCGNIGTFILIAIFWKLSMVFLRVMLIYRSLKSAITHHLKISKETKNLSEWIETLLLLDLFWSGIPLGVLTSYELYYYGNVELSHIDFNTVYELVKLSALAIDLIGASYLLYWVIVFGNEHHEDHEDKSGGQPTEISNLI